MSAAPKVDDLAGAKEVLGWDEPDAALATAYALVDIAESLRTLAAASSFRNYTVAGGRPLDENTAIRISKNLTEGGQQ
ncbi:hypothetical protein MINS_12090 [Mycolicibacterium insubricum]|uniref:Uncharacterized protein n=1 Tax=Mycolicibacterium insubricum TaxID=444597 RepID=A0A1X0CXH6_9MYCO|nr:hypothetical protein [Mycolicibacterium insubricum]MCV7079988.1 hypothetical protein [Mycolicibacterium insubricum]ORA64881.1 hypothetical protein BST26_19430 [Mycolicibacterium insubricum]BBZ65780.1 hypothetical protein MINS_12090 [Mycolicibacterium insubricum]